MLAPPPATALAMDPLDTLLQQHPDLAPFDLERGEDYRLWRQAKLAGYPETAAALVVEVADPAALTPAERAALRRRLAKTNMAVYRGPPRPEPTPGVVHEVGAQLGLSRWDPNYLGDEEGVSALTVGTGEARSRYIPYTDRPLQWHTDGYYNPPERRVRAFLLHCVRPAAEGGENALLDPEIAYIRLRDADPEYIRALMRPDALTIPPGTAADGRPRPAVPGPVFALEPEGGDLLMRYTARGRHVQWRADAATQRARAALEEVLHQPGEWRYELRLEAGMGLVCNNVLHSRSGFRDAAGGGRRLLYRARYLQRVKGTGLRARASA